jgi:hypothetical protein
VVGELDGLIDPHTRGRFKAVLHVVHRGLDLEGKQRCIMCGFVVLNHRRQMMDAQERRVDAHGRVIWGFKQGPVTTVFPPDPTQPPITVSGHVKYARPCTVPEKEWPYV